MKGFYDGARRYARKTWPVLLALVCFFFGYFIGGWAASATAPAPKEAAGEAKREILFWSCSMDPQVRRPGPGKCPFCGMPLEPVYAGPAGADRPRVLAMSEAARKLAEVETAPVERKFVTATVRMVGKVDYDETRVRRVTVWVSGRVERMYADYVGVPVKEGEHLFEFYSPELLTAQEELLVAKASGVSASLAAARDRLRLWGLLPKQIEEIERDGKASERITIYSPIGGTVVERSVSEGDFIKPGTKAYTIADLSRVWVKLDAYESDLAFVRYGQEVEFTTEAHPGEAFPGKIAFISPTLNERTRTVKVRVNVENPRGRLKPGMFVRATVRAKVAEGGRVMNPGLAGKWISPMHPEVVKDAPGTCDVCGMPLVRAEELGYVDDAPALAPLVIPASAPLITGRRAVVYIEVLDAEQPTYEGREVVLGPRAGEYYLVRSGLKEGERVVVKGNFKIDSAMQIQAKPSMMSAKPKTRPQETCPVMGGKVNKDLYVDVLGKRVHVRCPGCIEKIKAEPEKYLKVLEERGETAEDAPGTHAH